METPNTPSAAPSTGAWRAWFDGAAEPSNPGQRGIGALLEAPDGAVVAQVSRHIGFGTNNEAEYEALIAILEASVAAGAPSVTVYGDSQLVVEQLNGNWAVRSATLQPYWSRARQLLRTARARVAWIPRERNTRADELSKKALEHLIKKSEERGWGTLTMIGASLGISAVAVGRRLTELGLKEGHRTTELAIAEGIGRKLETGFGHKYEWNVAKAVELLRAIVPPQPAEEPKP